MKHIWSIGLLVFLPACGSADTSSTDHTKAARTERGEKKMSRIALKSGLSYEILAEGTGKAPVLGKQVTVHYTGWLDKQGAPGKKFDSSVDRGQPFSFVIGVGQVIKGWDEGVAGMKVGEKRRLYIPAALGYGARGAGAAIPPHADLIFDVELLAV